jgi:hypothetical protein
MSATVIEMHEAPFRGLLAAVLNQARKDAKAATRRARVVLARKKRGACGGRDHCRIRKEHVRAIAWFLDPTAARMGFRYVCDVLDLDADRVREHCLRGVDPKVLHRALRVQCGGVQAAAAWLDGGAS